MLDAKLVVVGGQTESSEIRLCLPMVIGRGNDADLVISDGLVSRRHAEIFEDDGRIFVRDLGSLNGTFINNHRIAEVELLNPQQLLTLGTVTFRAVYTPNPVEAFAGQDNGASTSFTMDTVKFESDFNETIKMDRGLIDSRRQHLHTNSGGDSNADTTDLDAYLIRSTQVERSVTLTSVEISRLKQKDPSNFHEDEDNLSKLKKIPR